MFNCGLWFIYRSLLLRKKASFVQSEVLGNHYHIYGIWSCFQMSCASHTKYRRLAIHLKIMYLMWVDAFKIQQIFFLTHQYLEKWVSLLEEIIVLREQNKQCKCGKIDWLLHKQYGRFLLSVGKNCLIVLIDIRNIYFPETFNFSIVFNYNNKRDM